MIADIIAQDAAGNDVLVAVVKTRRLSRDLVSEFFKMMREACPSIPFAMFVDLEEIQILRQSSINNGRPSCILKTAEILRAYDPEFGSKRIYPDFLRTLVEAWLRDLAYRLTNDVPPGSTEVAAIELLPRLAGGTTRSEVMIEANTVC